MKASLEWERRKTSRSRIDERGISKGFGSLGNLVALPRLANNHDSMEGEK